MKKKSLIFIPAFLLNYFVVVFISIFFFSPDSYNLEFTLGKLITTIVSLFFGLAAYQLYLKYSKSEPLKEKHIPTPEDKMKRKKYIFYIIAVLIILYNVLFIIIPCATGQTLAMVFLEKITDIFDVNFYLEICSSVENWFHNAFPMWKYRTFVELIDKSNLIFNATSSETFHAMFVFVVSYFFFSKIVLKEERKKLFAINS